MIKIDKLSKKYGDFVALDDLTVEIGDNEIFGFLGPNGAGKSTTMNIMTGYLSPTEGRVQIDGFDIVSQPLKAKKLIGYLPEIPPLYPDMTPKEYLTFVGRMKGISKGDIGGEVQRVMEITGLLDVKDSLIKVLSKGYKQRVGMAQAIMGDVKVIIMDEPTVGLDPIQIKEFRKMVVDLGKNHTVILSSHILSEISEVCTKIMVMVKGKLIAVDTPENLAKKVGKNGEDASLEDVFLELVEKETENAKHTDNI